MKKESLRKTAKQMVAPGKGILAADESFPSIEKRFKNIDLPSTEENRRIYREMLITTKGYEEFISGVILFDETIRQKTSSGEPFVGILKNKNLVPIIKVDQGLKPMEGSPEEKVSGQGLEGLQERLNEYVQIGAKATKWRIVTTIKKDLPSEENIMLNAETLAVFAEASQQAGLVPIVESEVLLDGDYSIKRSEEALEKILQSLFEKLRNKNVDLEGTVLKTSMVLPGKDTPKKATPKKVAGATIRVLKTVVPSELSGVVFLSGGQSELEATANLNEINKVKGQPWELSFSFARALQTSALKTWQGKNENVVAAQKKFLHRAKMNSLARSGGYSVDLE